MGNREAIECGIAVATRADVDIAVDWAAREGWNPGLHDADCFHAADTSGFLIGRVNGEPVTTISVVKYAGAFAFLGFYIAAPEWRGKGLGLRIWEAGLATLAGRVVGLDGVVAQQDNYRRSGFEFAWNNVRHEGIANGQRVHDSAIVQLSQVPFEEVRAFDQPFFPADRTAFLRCWIRQPQSTALGFVEAGQLRGYGVLRPCRAGYKVAPLFADSAQIAQRLFSALWATAPEGATVSLDTPATNSSAVELAQGFGMKPVFETARMYRGIAPAMPIERLYGITSFELG